MVKQMAGELAGRALKLVDIVAEDEVWGVSSKDITGYYKADVTFDARTPEETDRRKALAINLVNTGLLSKKTLRSEYMDVSDPDKENTQILVELAQQNPQVIQALVAGALRDWGADKLIQQLQEKEEMLKVKPSIATALQETEGQVDEQTGGGGNAPDIRTMRRAVPTATQMGGNGEQEMTQ